MAAEVPGEGEVDLVGGSSAGDGSLVDEGEGTTRYPPVEWQEVRDHLHRRLMFDDEWVVEGDLSLTWWGTPLPMQICQDGDGEFPDGDNVIHIRAHTDLFLVEDEGLACSIAADLRREFPMGSLIHEDGVLRLVSTLALNPLCRGNLLNFHQAVLVQAAAAVRIHDQLVEVEGLEPVPWVDRVHPVSGERADIDELVNLYLGPHQQITELTDDEVRRRWDEARPLLRDVFVEQGAIPGFTSEEVDFYTSPHDHGSDMAIGVNPEDWRREWLGMGLTVYANILMGGPPLDDVDTNAMNVDLVNSLVSLMGYVDSTPEIGTRVNTFIPVEVLGEYSGHGSEVLAINVGNLAQAVSRAARTVRRWIYGDDHQPELDFSEPPSGA